MTTTQPDLVQCATCGVERDATDLPQTCPICADERQWVPPTGQEWTTPGAAAHPDAFLTFEEVEPDVHAIEHHGVPGIGQRPLLVQTSSGNVLLEAPAHIDDDAIAAVRTLGGLSAIVASHPHMYGLQSMWSAAFDDCPVHVSAADEQWLGHRPRNTVVWSGTTTIGAELTASQPGGHFPGSVVVHWPGRDGRGVLFAGDTIFPTPATGWVTFMRSYPNRLPMSGAVVRRIAAHVARYDFDRLYNNFAKRVETDARAVVQRSAERYAAWVSGEYDHLTGGDD